MPLSARSRISEKLLADLAVVWEEHGKTTENRTVALSFADCRLATALTVNSGLGIC